MLKKYDVAISYASEDRDFVDKVANNLSSKGLKVYYDVFEKIAVRNWGRRLQEIIYKTYKTDSDFVVVFVSKKYVEKKWPKYELRSSLEGMLERNVDHLLLAKFDDTILDDFGISNDIVHIDLRQETPESFAEKIYAKINSFSENNQQDTSTKKVFLLTKFSLLVLFAIIFIAYFIYLSFYTLTSNKDYIESTENMIVGNLHLPVHTVFSARSGNDLRPFRIRSFINHVSSYNLPKDLLPYKEEYIRLQQDELQNGKSNVWNGNILRLKNWDLVTQNNQDEKKELIILVEPAEYFDFVITHLKLKEITITDEKGTSISAWDKYVNNYEFTGTPNKNLVNYFGVSLTAITSDGYVILSKRSNRNAVVPKVMHVSIAEGTKFPDDTTKEKGNLLYNTALRGAREELCISINENQVEFLGLMYSTELAQFDIAGTVQIDLKKDEIVNIRRTGCQDQIFENDNIIFERFYPELVVKLINRQQHWSPFALASLIQTLYYNYGYTEVNKEFQKINGGKPIYLHNFTLKEKQEQITK
ncbi:MAG: toll/interleukin-1 receptor domain-containing protein [Magnetococcales bacterium]|nr:toll/interleukin-1 receptor domain-containing protein [Magnetococcales bacterium]